MLTERQYARIADLLEVVPLAVGSISEQRLSDRLSLDDVPELIAACRAHASLLHGQDNVQPQSIVALKVSSGTQGQRTHWVTESPEQVRDRIARAGAPPALVRTANVEGPLIRLTTVRGMQGFDLWTRHDNVTSIEVYR